MNKKGFTLVELLVTIVIMMLILFMVVPAITSLQNNNKNRPYEMYGESLIEAAKLYVVKEGEDLTDLETKNWSGCIDITYQNLMDSKLIKPYSEDEIDCSNSTVRYTRENGSDSYEYSMECTDEDSEVVYSKSYESGGSNCYQSSDDEKETLINFADYLLAYQTNPASLTNYNKASDDEKSKLFIFSHAATKQTEALTEYRYIGDNPRNFVYFNDELWRIIGVFSTEDEKGVKRNQVKLVRNTGIGNYAWDSSASTINSGRGINEWTQSDIRSLLTNTYYNRTNGTCYNALNNGSTVCDFGSIGLTAQAKTLISNSKYYLGGLVENMTMSASGLYTAERNTNTIASPADGVTRTTNALSSVGLMYPSDYAYTFANSIDSTCYSSVDNCNASRATKSWLYNSSFNSIDTKVDVSNTNTTTKQSTWFMTPYSKEAYSGFGIDAKGQIYRYAYYDSSSFSVKPVVYLNLDVYRKAGRGTNTDPYVLGEITPTCTIELDNNKNSIDWYKTVTGTVKSDTNGGSEVTDTIITDDNTSSKTSITVSNHGVTTLKATVTNSTGKQGTCTKRVQIDKQPPSIPRVAGYKWNSNSSANPTSNTGLSGLGSNVWTNKNVFTMPVGSEDKESGIERYLVKVEGAGTNIVDYATKYRNIVSEGITYISFKACDKLGNCSAYSSPFIYKRDTQLPTMPTILSYKWNSNTGATPTSPSGLGILSSTEWTNKNAFLIPTGSSDAASGLANYQVRVTGSYNITTMTNSYFNITREGTSTVVYHACDVAGNCSTGSRPFIYRRDTTAPTPPTVVGYKWKSNSDESPTSATGLTQTTTNKWINKNLFTIPKGSTDAGSGIQEYQVKVTGAATNISNYVADYRNIRTEGTSQISYRACDKLGNCSNYSSPFIYKRDTKPPYLSSKSKCIINYEGGYCGGGTTTHPVVLHTSFIDAGSGISGGKYSFPGGTTSSCTGTQSGSLIISSNEAVTNLCGCQGVYKFNNVCDKVGNCTSKSYSVTNSSSCNAFNNSVG